MVNLLFGLAESSEFKADIWGAAANLPEKNQEN